MNTELLSLVDAIVRDKGIDREVLIQAIESALASAIKKGMPDGEEREVIATLDRQQGGIAITMDGKKLSSTEFSRIGAQTAKQVIMQKIREAERDVILGEFQGKVGDVISGTVQRFERGDIIVDVGRAEALLPKSERIPFEEYRPGDQIQTYVLEVRKGLRGAEIILSRAHEGFIRGLFALEVPEVADGTVEIKGIAREPGDRTKIAVASTDEKVDSQGACIGVRGTRVKNIVRELRGEKVDVVRWDENITRYLEAALAPAQVAEIRTDESLRQATVVVNDDQLSLAIGKKGQNVRLASKLTGWELDIKSRSQLTAATPEVRNVPGVGPAMEARLREGGITSVEQLAAVTVEQLTAIRGIGGKTAEKLIDAARQTLTHAQEAAAAQSQAASEPPAASPEEPVSPETPPSSEPESP